MFKEFIICIIIVLTIFFGDFKTKQYTVKAIDETTNDLEELRKVVIINDEEVNKKQAKDKIDKIHRKWDEKYEVLAYYIEHNELEKVETELTGLRAYIEKDEFSDALVEIDKSMYILEHIKDKNMFEIKNIF